MSSHTRILDELTDRSRAVFRRVVEEYLAHGEPVGSRSLSRTLEERVSPATIRNVMQDLEYLGLLTHPHVSAGRVPTELGLRLFVDCLLETRELEPQERAHLESWLQPEAEGGAENVATLLDKVGTALSGLTGGASLVLAPKREAPIRHIEFVSLAPDRALVVLVFADGQVENRLFHPPPGMTPSAMREAANFLNAVLEGRTLSEMRQVVAEEIARRRREIDRLAGHLIDAGLAVWQSNEAEERQERLIVRGRANLLEELEDKASEEELERIRALFDDLERKRDIADFLELAEEGEGIRIFIGSENKLFSLTGSSLVVSPYMNADRKVIGAVGVIGPTRLNYGRIVPIVDYTAQLVGRMLSDRR